jgi:NifB/MoaA-like Fe-S oxidoreductase
MAGRPLPGPRFYEGFPQLQNGVGLVRVMLDDWRRSRRKVPASLPTPRRVAWLSGKAAAPALQQIAEDFRAAENLGVDVRVVTTRCSARRSACPA